MELTLFRQRRKLWRVPGCRWNRLCFLPAVSGASDNGHADRLCAAVSSLRIDNTYLFSRLRDRASEAAIFNNHIIRTKWNWQFNRELSFRMILQYTATLANSTFTSLPTTKQFNADFLLTYLIHPGTAIYVGYNSDLQNIDPALQTAPERRTRAHARPPD